MQIVQRGARGFVFYKLLEIASLIWLITDMHDVKFGIMRIMQRVAARFFVSILLISTAH